MPRLTVQNNYCHDTNSMGINFVNSGRDSDNISGLTISGNIVVNACQVVSDCGAIYVEDIGARNGGISIKNNYIVNYLGTSNSTTHGIYLDQAASNVEVKYNIVRAMSRGDALVSSFMMSSGENNRIENNVLDQGCSGAVSIGQIISYPTGFVTSMTGNVISRNLMLFHFAGAQTTTGYSNGASYQMGGTVKAPWKVIISNNNYFNSKGGPAVATGNDAGDAAPSYVDPQITDATYQVANGAILSAPFSWVDIITAWGPPGRWPNGKFPWMPALCQ